jgi:ACS family D-galactonate transporter-like MFS transporter
MSPPPQRRSLVGGWINDQWRARGGTPNQVFGTMFAVAALFTAVSIFAVGYVRDPITVVAFLSVVLFFLRWCGTYWAIPSILATRDRAGFLCGCMNLGGNIAGITVSIIVGFIVQITGS